MPTTVHNTKSLIYNEQIESYYDFLPRPTDGSLAGRTVDYFFNSFSFGPKWSFYNFPMYMRVTYPKNYDPTKEWATMVHWQGAGQDNGTSVIGQYRENLDFEGLHKELPSANLGSGSVTLDSGASGSVNSITVDGVEIMNGVENFDTDLTTTAQNVVDSINTKTSSPNYRAYLNGSGSTTIIISDASAQYLDTEGLVISADTTTITTTDEDMSVSMIFVTTSNREAVFWQFYWIQETIGWCLDNLPVDRNRFCINGLSFGGEAVIQSGMHRMKNSDTTPSHFSTTGQDYRYRISHMIPYAPHSDFVEFGDFYGVVNYLGVHGDSDVTAGGFDYNGHKNEYHNYDQTGTTLEYKFLGLTGVAHTGWQNMYRNDSTWWGRTLNSDTVGHLVNIYDWIKRTALTDRAIPVFLADYSGYTVEISGTSNVPLDHTIRIAHAMMPYDSNGKRLYNEQDVTSMVKFKLTSSGGTDVPFTAKVISQYSIRVTPNSDMINNQYYWMEYTAYDYEGNAVTRNATFRAGNNKRVYYNLTRAGFTSTLSSYWNNAGAAAGSQYTEFYSRNTSGITDAGWVIPDNTVNSADVQITGTSMPVWSVGDYFYVEDHSLTNNRGRYRIAAVNTSGSDYDCYKESGGVVSGATAEAIDFYYEIIIKTAEQDTTGILHDEDVSPTGWFVRLGGRFGSMGQWGGTAYYKWDGDLDNITIPSNCPKDSYLQSEVYSYFCALGTYQVGADERISTLEFVLDPFKTYEFVVFVNSAYSSSVQGAISINRVEKSEFYARHSRKQIVVQGTSDKNGVVTLELEERETSAAGVSMSTIVFYEIEPTFDPLDIAWSSTYNVADVPSDWNSNTGATITNYGSEGNDWLATTSRPNYNSGNTEMEFNGSQNISAGNEDLVHPYEYWIRFKLSGTTGYGIIADVGNIIRFLNSSGSWIINDGGSNQNIGSSDTNWHVIRIVGKGNAQTYWQMDGEDKNYISGGSEGPYATTLHLGANSSLQGMGGIINNAYYARDTLLSVDEENNMWNWFLNKPVVFEGDGGIGTAVGVPVDIPYPTGITEGDLLIIQVMGALNGVTHTTSSEFTDLEIGNTGGGHSTSFFSKIADGTETGTIAVSGDSYGNVISGVMTRYSGVDPINPIDTTANGEVIGTGTGFTLNDINVVTQGSYVAAHICIEDNISISGGTNYKEVWQYNDATGSRSTHALYAQTNSPTGLVTGETLGLSPNSSDVMSWAILSIKPIINY